METSKDIGKWFADRHQDSLPAEVESFGHELHIVRIAPGALFTGQLVDTSLYGGMYLQKGNLKVGSERRKVTLEAPMFIDAIDLKAINDIESSPDCIGYIILLNHTFLKEATTEVYRHVDPELFTRHFNNPQTALTVEESESFNKIIEFLIYTIHNKNHTFRRDILNTGVRLLFYELWEIIIRRNRTKPRTAVNIHWENRTSHFMYLVHTHCHEHHDVNWYANKMCITPEKLTGLLKKVYGKTANTLIDEAIMTEAKVYLRNPNLSIQEISELLSFADQSTFGKFFKRHSGHSPANYRKGRT